MNASAIAGALARLRARVEQGALPVEETLLLVPEARVLRVRVAADPTGARLEASVGPSAEERGTTKALFRGSPAALLAEFGRPDLVDRVGNLIHELMHAAAWTDQMLLPRGATPPGLPSPAASSAARARVRDLLLAAISTPNGFAPVLSPPLPEAWPLTRGARLVTYAAATRFTAPTLFAHTEVLGRVRHDPLCGEEPRAERWSAAAASAGVASVVPLDVRELERLQSVPSLDECYAKVAAGIPDRKLEANLRAQFAFQRRRAGWLLELVRGHHLGLLSWLQTEAA